MKQAKELVAPASTAARSTSCASRSPDQHGILRGKTLVASEARAALWDGVQPHLDPARQGHLAQDRVLRCSRAGGGFAIEGFQGGADFTVVADPATFKVLPWAPRTGWILCDAYMADGKPCPFATRQISAARVKQLDATRPGLHRRPRGRVPCLQARRRAHGLADSGQPGEPPRVSPLSHGHQYLTELRYDRLDAGDGAAALAA